MQPAIKGQVYYMSKRDLLYDNAARNQGPGPLNPLTKPLCELL
jgi:hypothetical protein